MRSLVVVCVLQSYQSLFLALSADKPGRSVRGSVLRDYCARIIYPEPAGLFESSMRMWIGKRIYIIACVYCAICIILTCDVYLSDLQVLKIWTLDLQPDLGRPSRAKPSKASSVGSPQKSPKPCDWRECEAVYFGKEARMESFAAVPTMSSCSSMYESTITDQ